MATLTVAVQVGARVSMHEGRLGIGASVVQHGHPPVPCPPLNKSERNLRKTSTHCGFTARPGWVSEPVIEPVH